MGKGSEGQRKQMEDAKRLDSIAEPSGNDSDRNSRRHDVIKRSKSGKITFHAGRVGESGLYQTDLLASGIGDLSGLDGDSNRCELLDRRRGYHPCFSCQGGRDYEKCKELRKK